MSHNLVVTIVTLWRPIEWVYTAQSSKQSIKQNVAPRTCHCCNGRGGLFLRVNWYISNKKRRCVTSPVKSVTRAPVLVNVRRHGMRCVSPSIASCVVLPNRPQPHHHWGYCNATRAWNTLQHVACSVVAVSAPSSGCWNCLSDADAAPIETIADDGILSTVINAPGGRLLARCEIGGPPRHARRDRPIWGLSVFALDGQ